MKKEVVFHVDAEDRAEVEAKLLEINQELLRLEQRKLELEHELNRGPNQRVLKELNTVINDVARIRWQYKKYAERQASLDTRSGIIHAYEQDLSPEDFDPKKIN